MKEKISQEIEEYLEMLYRVKEKKEHAKTVALASALKIKPASVSEMLRKLEKRGMVKYTPYRGAELTKKGEAIGGRIIRKHRLIERFLGFIGVKRDVHERACVLEHAIPDDIEDGIKKLMKGKAIPLANLHIGAKARVAGITADKKTTQRLRDMGLTNGTEVTVIRTAPFRGPVELAVRGTRLAIGRKLAARILTR